MTSMLRRLKNRFYPSHDHKVTFLGLHGSGKTTLLYYLKTGKIVTTISTIGFNIETIELTAPSGNSLRMQAWEVGTGFSYVRSLIPVYLASSDAIVWVVDSTDEFGLSESVESLQDILSPPDSGYKTEQQVLPPKNIPILILANKSDLVNNMSLDYIRICFAKVTLGRLSAVFSSCATEGTALKNSGLPEAFEWLLLAIEIQIAVQKENIQKDIHQQMINSEHRELEFWLTRIETDLETEEFLEKFRSFTLTSWDHYTRIRIAYVLLTKYGRKEGKDLIFNGLETYISSDPHITENHSTNMPPLPSDGLITPTPSTDPPLVPSQLASPNDFTDFLLINPHITESNLWADYYTKETMMSFRAKSEMVLPDKKSLPNLVVRDAIAKFMPLK